MFQAMMCDRTLMGYIGRKRKRGKIMSTEERLDRIERNLLTMSEMIIELVSVTRKQQEAIAQQQVETQRIWEYLMKQVESGAN